MAQKTAAEVQHNVETKTEVAAERIAKALNTEVGEGVKARNWPQKDKDVILVTWEEATTGVNSYHKAGLIDDVYQSGANVELHTTEDDNSALQFQLRD